VPIKEKITKNITCNRVDKEKLKTIFSKPLWKKKYKEIEKSYVTEWTSRS
jgi:hypothetical protein